MKRRCSGTYPVASLGLSSLSCEARLLLLDRVLDGDIVTADDRRQLLVNHERLAASAEFFSVYDLMVEDEGGQFYLRLEDGEKAYDLDDFLRYLQRDKDRLTRLTRLVRSALFKRLVEDFRGAL